MSQRDSQSSAMSTGPGSIALMRAVSSTSLTSMHNLNLKPATRDDAGCPRAEPWIDPNRGLRRHPLPD
eukprot:scaffold30415_cov124-Isochrysis_galbana.AAC.1